MPIIPDPVTGKRKWVPAPQRSTFGGHTFLTLTYDTPKGDTTRHTAVLRHDQIQEVLDLIARLTEDTA